MSAPVEVEREIVELEEWHRQFDEVWLNGGGLDVAVAVADHAPCTCPVSGCVCGRTDWKRNHPESDA